MIENFFTCPYCWQEISMLLDNSVSQQQYIEDCEVCCRPIQVKASFQEQELHSFSVEVID
jgi:hypothetical protein